MLHWIDDYFGLSQAGTTVRTEIVAGATTFLTMAYIIFVNPAILAEAGMDEGAVFVATCLAAAAGSALMGLIANYPIAVAPGMGLNAFFTYGVVLGMGHSWEAALGAVFVSGILFLILSILPVRGWIINAIPRSQRLAISAGLGLFLGLIALRNAGIVVDHPATLVGLGNLASATVLLAIGCFVLIGALEAQGVPGAILIGMGAVTALGIVLGVSPFEGLIALPPDIAPTFLAMDVAGALEIGMVSVVLAFLFVDIFDTAGTLIGVSHRAGLLDEKGNLPRMNRAFISDSSATIAGAAFGTSPVTSYMESAAGVKAGGRTGLTAVVTAVLFLACIFLAPAAATIQDYATAPALLYVACVMARGISEFDWEDVTDFVPGIITVLTMPLTFSIANGIGFGLVAYTALKLLGGRSEQVSIPLMVVSALFVAKFLWLDG